MSKEHLNYLRRKTADEAELWAADRIEELEGANILNSNALRLQKKKCDALRADNAELVAALEHSVLYVPDLATVPGIAAALAKVRKPT